MSASKLEAEKDNVVVPTTREEYCIKHIPETSGASAAGGGGGGVADDFFDDDYCDDGDDYDYYDEDGDSCNGGASDQGEDSGNGEES